MVIPLIENIKKFIVQPIIAVLFALAGAYFLWGVAQYVWNAGSDEKRLEGGKHMAWGLVGMFIMISVFGIIRLICNTIGTSC